MFDFLISIITSHKFYLPVIFIAAGIVSYEIISKTIRKVSNINTKITKTHSKGYDKRKSTVVGLINNIIKYIIAIIVIIAKKMRFVNHSRNILHFGINAKNTFGFCESCPSFSREFLHVTVKVAIEIPERRWYNIREDPD